MGQLYLSNVDFLKNGVPASIIATFVRSPLLALSSVPLIHYASGRCHSRILAHESHRVCFAYICTEVVAHIFRRL